MKRKLGVLFTTVGALLILASSALFLHNENEAKRAAEAANKVLPSLQNLVGEEPSSAPEAPKIKTVDGYDYIGYISIPALEIDLPVMADWDYKRLKIAPCRHFGSVENDDLVVAGHNYKRHFGRLSSLRADDLVIFTDVGGQKTEYKVKNVEKLSPTAVDEVKNGDWDLTLYTCAYGNKARVVVRCDRAEPNRLEGTSAFGKTEDK